MSSQLLLFAEPLLRDGLTRLLTAQADLYTVAQTPEELKGRPQLVLWQVAGPGSRGASLESLDHELQLLQERWQPAPLLLLLPAGHGLAHGSLVQLPAAGVLETPTPQELLEAIENLGGAWICGSGTGRGLHHDRMVARLHCNCQHFR